MPGFYNFHLIIITCPLLKQPGLIFVYLCTGLKLSCLFLNYPVISPVKKSQNFV